MKDDSHIFPEQPAGQAELEARIVAWVLGEASAFEAAELERRCAEDPELRDFERRMRTLHGWIGGDVEVKPEADWRLPEEKRSRITDLLGIEATENLRGEKTAGYFARRTLLAAAACVALTLVAWPVFMKQERKTADGALSEAIVASYNGRASLRAEMRSEMAEVPGNSHIDGLRSAEEFGLGWGALSVDKKVEEGTATEYLKSLRIDEPGVGGDLKAEGKMSDFSASPPTPQYKPNFAGKTTFGVSEPPSRPSASPAPEKDALAAAGLRRGNGTIDRDGIDAILNPSDRGRPKKDNDSAGDVMPLSGTFSKEAGDTLPSGVAKGGLRRDLASETTGDVKFSDLQQMGSLLAGKADDTARTIDLYTGYRYSDFSQMGRQAGAVDYAEGYAWRFDDPKRSGESAGKGYSGDGYGSLAQNEMIRRRNAVVESDRLRDEGREAYAKGDYKQAHDKFTEAEKLLPDAPMVKDRRDYLGAIQGDAAYALGEQYRKVGKYEEAREIALKRDPGNENAQRLKDSIDDPIRTNPALAYEPAGNVDEVRRSLYLAEGNYNLGKFDDAKKVYEEVLRIDPYNKAARRGMERVQMAKKDYYRAAYDHTRAELLAEVDASWEPGDPPMSRGMEEGVSVAQTDAGRKVNVPKAGDSTDNARAELMALVDAAWELAAPREEKTAERLTETAAEPFSTFSLHVSDASFRLASAALARGERPAAESVRAEEFYNAFDYGDPAPLEGEPVACAIEQAAHPALPQRNLVRIGVRTGAQGRGGSTPLNLTLLLDGSGSMEREDRREGLARAVESLAGLLKEGDTVTVASFARQPRLLADRLPGAESAKLAGIVAGTPSGGGTNLEEGLKLAGELALRQFREGAQNRIVLFTDGAANLGDAEPESLQAMVEGFRRRGIAFDAAGVGAEGLNDRLLERLTRNGNGRYYVVDRPEDAEGGFAEKLAGAFRPAAEDVKVQVRFNAARVARYRLIGFEEHRLEKEDFRDDSVDAAEMAAEEAGNALYQIEVLSQGEGDVGEVSVRFRDAGSGEMVERSWTIPYEERAAGFDEAHPSLQLAGLAALVAGKLKGEPEMVDFGELAPVMAKVKERYAGSGAVEALGRMFEGLR